MLGGAISRFGALLTQLVQGAAGSFTFGLGGPLDSGSLREGSGHDLAKGCHEMGIHGFRMVGRAAQLLDGVRKAQQNRAAYRVSNPMENTQIAHGFTAR